MKLAAHTFKFSQRTYLLVRPIGNSDVGNDIENDIGNGIGDVIVSANLNVVVSDIVNDVGFWGHIRYRLRPFFYCILHKTKYFIIVKILIYLTSWKEYKDKGNCYKYIGLILFLKREKNCLFFYDENFNKPICLYQFLLSSYSFHIVK